MYKYFMAIGISLFAFINSFAQTGSETYQPTFANPASSMTSTAPLKNSKITPTPTPALSEKDFKNAVNSQFQRNQNQLNQQAQENLSKNLPMAKPSTTAATPSANPSNNATPTQLPTQVPAPVTNTSEPAAMPTSNATTPNPAPLAAPAQPTASQPYTGFGTTNSKSGKSNQNTGSQKSGSGWNIQY